MAEQMGRHVMFARLAKSTPDLDALQRVEALVRVRFGLAEDALVLVSEEAERIPGRSSVMTTVLFWQRGDRHRVRVFKPVAEVAGSDLPAGWLKGALRDDGEVDCC